MPQFSIIIVPRNGVRSTSEIRKIVGFSAQTGGMLAFLEKMRYCISNYCIRTVNVRRPCGAVDGREITGGEALRKILVAMSGGVDSAAACVLLRQQGYEVGGATMLLRDGGEAEAEDARRAAEELGIPFYLFEWKDAFRRRVIEPFTRVYRSGGTPNPCVICNGAMKFGMFLEKALELGYDGIATGHYARVERESGRFLLRRAADRAKDQTYMLCKLTQAQLARTLFPLGGIVSKEETRRLAQEAGLTLARKHDSQDICFVPDGDYMAYLTANGLVPQAGRFVTPDGRVLGPHRGLEAYTVGQRRGLGMAFGERMYVLGKRGTDVVVGEERLLFSRRVEIGDVNYIPYDRPPGPLRVEAALRYTPRTAPAWLYPNGPACTLLFDEPQRAATEGQTAVFYDGETVVGGGTIRAAESGLRNLNETEGIEK